MGNWNPRPWDRQPGEPAKAHEAFKVYRDIPATKRTIAFTSEKAKRNPRTISKWLHVYRWRERVLAMDSHEEQMMEEECSRARVRMRRSQVNKSEWLMMRGSQFLEKSKKVTPTVALAMIVEGGKMQRAVLGVPDLTVVTSRAPEEPTSEVTRAIVTDPDLLALAQDLADRVDARLGTQPGGDGGPPEPRGPDPVSGAAAPRLDQPPPG